jgi:hypothetical protein
VRCSEISTARSRAATIVSIARSSLVLALRAFLGAAKSSAPVIFFKIFPQRPPGDIQMLPLIRGLLMASGSLGDLGRQTMPSKGRFEVLRVPIAALHAVPALVA